MPDWAKALFILAAFAVWIIYGLISGRMRIKSVIVSRAEQPEMFYGWIGFLILMMIAVVFILLTEYHFIPDFIHQ